MTSLTSTSTIEFRGHKYIRVGVGAGFNFSDALRDVTLLTESEFQALEEEKKSAFRLIQLRDLKIIENKFGKENKALALLQGKAVIDLFELNIVDGNVFTHAGMKTPLGLLLTLEAAIGHFSANYDNEVEEIETLQGKMVISLLRLRLKSNGRVDMAGGDKTALGLIRTLRRAVKECVV